MKTDVDSLKRNCPMPVLLHRIGLGEFAKNNCRSPFRSDKKPSWGIFQRDEKWFFKDQATGDSGDEITLLARWKGLDEKRDFPQLVKHYAELAGVPSNGDGRQHPGATQPGKGFFSWSACVAAFTPTEAETLAQWRGYSTEFCAWLKTENVIGLHEGNWALPVYSEAGAVIGTHYRVDRGNGVKPDWFYRPRGIGVRPLVFGDPKQNAIGFVFESPWDAFALMDKLGWHKPKGIPDTAVVTTRGASNGKFVAGLFTPQTTVYAFRQNDAAAEKWLADVCTHSDSKVFHVATPTRHKDLNDWTLAGATGTDIMGAIQAAKLVEAIAPKIQATARRQNADCESAAPIGRWPDPLEPSALHGVAGELVRRLDPHTEADPAAILFQLLIAFGNLIGRTVYFKVEAHRHYCNMNGVLVGNTSKARKGTSWGHVCGLLATIDSSWKRPASGMSTGEGLIWAVRDPIERQEPIREKGKVTGYQYVVVDEGVADKRLLCVEEEFSRVLKCANREHCTLSAVFRQAFDTGNLRILTKTNPAQATEAHISVIGHITRQELTRHLADTECANGFANRIPWVCVRRSKELPEGGFAHVADFSDIEAQLKKAVAFARTCSELRRDTEAREFWRSIYHDLSAAKPGLFGAVTSRAEAYVVRLSLVYAVLDCAEYIRREHLEAALAAWRYCEDSARYIFGESLGDPDADAILAALREAGAVGLTRTEINEQVFNRHRSKSEIDRALNMLAECALAESKTDPTEGRAAERWFAK